MPRPSSSSACKGLVPRLTLYNICRLRCTFHTVNNKHCTRLATHLYTILYHLPKNGGNEVALASFQGPRPASGDLQYRNRTTSNQFWSWVGEGLGMWLGLCESWWWKGTYQKPWLSRYLVRSTFTFGSCTCGRCNEEQFR